MSDGLKTISQIQFIQINDEELVICGGIEGSMLRPLLFLLYINKVFCMRMDRAPVFFYCLKLCCKLSFSAFLPSTVPHSNWSKSLTCHFNHNTHNITFCIFTCRTLKNFYKLLVMIVICNEKQMNRSYKQHFVKMSPYFYQKYLQSFLSNAGKTENLPEFECNKF